MNIFVDKEEYGANANMATSMELQPLRTLDKNMSASTVDFFETLNENVVANIAKIKTNVEEVKVLQRRILVSVKSDEKDAAENQMNNLVEESKRLSRKIQMTLKNEKAKIEEKSNKEPSTIKKWTNKKQVEEKIAKRKTEMRMRQIQIDSQSTTLSNIWEEFNLNQANYRDKSKELLVRRCKIANNKYNDEEIEAMLEEGKTDVFNECILGQMKSTRQQLTELQDRHDEFIKLEKSVKEVHDMFLEISNLVTQQGEKVDNIMQNVTQAGEDVERGVDHLRRARRYKISSRKMKIILLVVAIVLVLVILIVILSKTEVFTSGDTSESKTTTATTSTLDMNSSTATSEPTEHTIPPLPRNFNSKS